LFSFSCPPFSFLPLYLAYILAVTVPDDILLILKDFLFKIYLQYCKKPGYFCNFAKICQ